MQLNRPGNLLNTMTGEAPGPSGQWVQQGSVQAPSNDEFSVGKSGTSNVSVQTGEEFSIEFLQDRVGPRKMPPISDMVQNREKGVGFDQNRQLGYEDLTRVLGLRRMDSEGASELSEFVSAKASMVETENGSCSDKMSKYQNDAPECGPGQRKFTAESNCEQAAFGPTPGPVHGTDSPHSHKPYGSDGSQSGKLKLLCSFGGKILPRPSDGKLRYVGGETRIISIRINLSWGELVKKTSGICNQPHTIKYQLPGEDLDALISVSSDEDLQNMLEEYHGFEKLEGSQRLRIFLIPLDTLFEASSISQSNSGYQYVVAVNGIVDRSPRKSSSGQSLANTVGQLGTNLARKPSFKRNSPAPLLHLDIKSGVNVLHPAKFLHEPQNLMKSPIHSPPFSPIPVMQGDLKSAQTPLYRNNSFQGSNESNSSFITAQLPPESSSADAAGFDYPPHGLVTLMNYHYPYKEVDVSQTDRHCGVHFPDGIVSRELEAPSVSDQNDSDLDGFSCGRPMIKERTFHSEKSISHPKDPIDLLSGSNESIDSHQGMSHAFSDSKLQEHGGRSVYCSQEGFSPSSPLNFSKTQVPSLLVSGALQENQMKLRESTDFVNPRTPNIESTDSQLRFDLINFSMSSESLSMIESNHQCHHKTDEKHQMAKEDVDKSNLMIQKHYEENILSREMNRIDEKDNLLHQGGKLHESRSSAPAMEDQNEMSNISSIPTFVLGVNTSMEGLQVSRDMVPASFGIDLEPFVDTVMQPQNFQLDRALSELNVGQNYAKDQHCVVTRIRSDDHGSDASWIRNSGVSGRFPGTKTHSCDENPLTDLIYGLSSNPHESPKLPPVAHRKDTGLQHPTQVNSTDLHSSSVHVDACQGAHLDKNVLTKSTREASLKQEGCLLVDDFLNYPYQKVDKFAPSGCSYEKSNIENIMLVHSKSHNKSNEQSQLKSGVIVEDVMDGMPPGMKSLSSIVPHVVAATSSEILSPSATEADSSVLESESEDAKVDDGDKDDSISDAVIAEIEAGIYGLQIIKNSDLEELRELGSGTYGTVYHGKWRGTDVAIKRIKKSCFAGRSSEQERLTKDFWREAQILSNLHHPNVLAFYGVVPDGAGGTLATVTEFMVNGSLRHVLVKKDRLLDRRKKLIIAMDAAFGMEYLHSKNIVHFDLKCDNLLVNLRDPQRPICKVGDFGLSRIKRNTLVSGGVRGTLPWMAPELLNGSSSRVSEKVDVFSFGIAMWEILTGEEPYANLHCGAIIGGILKNTLRPPIPERCNTDWRKLMEQCWSPDPESRPSFTEVTSRLRSMSAAIQAKGHSNQARPMKSNIAM